MTRRSNSSLRIFWTLLLALGLTACASTSAPEPASSTPEPTFTPAPPTPTLEPMALSVNGEGIPLAEFNAEVQRYITAQTALGKTVDPQTAAQAVAEDFIAQVLLAQGARANGFSLDDAGLQARVDALAAQAGGAEALSAWQQAHGYSDQSFRSALKRAAEAAWMRDKIVTSISSTAEQVHVQQILLYNRETAENFLLQLNGGANFDELALRADPLTRGDLGWVPRGYLLDPQIEEAVFRLEAGQYSEVIETPVGFHIVKVLERDPNRPLSPDAYLALQERTLKRWLEEQKQFAKIEIFAP
ncbi:MAG: peptidylprolyl isomerase [Chloroflexi bacterium]|nr:peptidylprolyl isomerase [Chloroflexota bacterium]MBI5702622.1 peptidylprolyl isomerase [Chloroflexota bacterium]